MPFKIYLVLQLWFILYCVIFILFSHFNLDLIHFFAIAMYLHWHLTLSCPVVTMASLCTFPYHSFHSLQSGIVTWHTIRTFYLILYSVYLCACRSCAWVCGSCVCLFMDARMNKLSSHLISKYTFCLSSLFVCLFACFAMFCLLNLSWERRNINVTYYFIIRCFSMSWMLCFSIVNALSQWTVDT